MPSPLHDVPELELSTTDCASTSNFMLFSTDQADQVIMSAKLNSRPFRRRRVSPSGSAARRPQTVSVFRPLRSNMKWFLGVVFFFTLWNTSSAGIGCFVCSSFNRSTPECEDHFNSSIAYPASSAASNYQFPCWAFKKDRKGLFPADHCVKVSGYQTDNPSQTLVIRTCAFDSGTLTADTEIVRISHCGHFRYEGKQYTGCVQSCDTDGCNSARQSIRAIDALKVFIIFLILN